MLKDATYKDKFALLSTWMPSIIDVVKRDLKNDHLRHDAPFVRSYFTGKVLNKLALDELVEAYQHAIAEGERGEELGEFIANRWLLKNAELYHYFEQELTKINPDFSDLELLDAAVATGLMEQALTQFSAPQTYVFCVLNSVVFPQEVFKKLEERAKKHVEQEETAAAVRCESESKEALIRNHEQQVARLTDKYEKKLLGMQKKYTADVEALKKQIAALQRKLNG